MKESMEETFQSPPFNRKSIFSFIAAILTVISTWHGIRALRRTGSLRGGEKAMSMAGIAASALAVLMASCSAAAVAILGFRLVEAIGRLFR